VLMPRLRRHLDADGQMLLASLLAAGVLAVLAAAPPRPAALALMLVLGLGWIVALTTLNGVAQSILPNWVRGRALAVYLTVFNGAMAAGSLAWGLVAHLIGVPAAMLVAAAGLSAAALLLHRARLPAGDSDLQPSRHWPEPLLALPVDPDRGPVLVLVDYRIRPDQIAPFLKALSRLSEERRRNGACAWGVAEQTDAPGRLTEWFFVESWAEHLRHHERVSLADAALQREVQRWHVGPQPPAVRHLLAL